MNDDQTLGTPASEPANFDNQLASLINRVEGNAPMQPAATRARDEAGKFVKTDENGYSKPIEPEKVEEKSEVKADPVKAAKADGTKEEPPAEDEEDYLELAPEKDGEQPTRLKIAEVLDGYKKAKELSTEVETLRQQTSRMPVEVEKELGETIAARQQYLNGLQVISQLLQVPEPNIEYLNQNSPNYSPETYYAQVQQAQKSKEMLGALQAQAERARNEQTEAQKKIAEAKIAREMNSLLQAWPEFKDTKVQEKFVADAAREYNLTVDELKSVTSARDYQILRDALAYRASKAARETATAEAVKIVKAKPKLVRGSARQPSGKQAAYSDAMDRLTKSHSMEDGLAALRAMNL